MIVQWITQVARSIFYDDQNIPTNLGDTVQEALDNLYQTTQVVASPGFVFGYGGNAPNNTWFNNEEVPSNKVGVPVRFSSASIQEINIGVEDLTNMDVSVYEHDGDEIALTLLTTVSIVVGDGRTKTHSVNVPVSTGRQLAIRITSGSSKNPKVTLLIKGEL